MDRTQLTQKRSVLGFVPNITPVTYSIYSHNSIARINKRLVIQTKQQQFESADIIRLTKSEFHNI